MEDEFSVPGAEGGKPAEQATQTQPTQGVDPNAVADQVLVKLEPLIDKLVESKTSKGYARAMREFNKSRDAIKRTAEITGMDEKAVADATQKAFNKAMLAADAEEETVPQREVARKDPQPQPAPSNHAQQLQAWVKQTYGLDSQDLDVSKFAGFTSTDDPRAQQLVQAAQQAVATKATKKQSPAAKAKQQYGTLGNVLSQGSPAPSNPIENIDDPDKLWDLATKG